MEWIFLPEAWLALVTLTALEIVLGIDNIIFISILVSKLPKEQQDKARIVGLSLAMGTRILLLVFITWIMGLTATLVEVGDFALTGRDVILLGGGLFLITKSTKEIHHALEGQAEASSVSKSTWTSVLIQIALIDIVFSFDSVITGVMICAVIISIIVMMFASKSIMEFIDDHPTMKMLALSFLILIGVALIGEGFHMHIPKGYIYFAMFYAVCVELINMRMRKAKALKLRKKNMT